MSHFVRRFFGAFVVTMVAGCDCGPGKSDPDSGVDSGPSDSGIDAGQPDAGPPDSGMLDAGKTDAGMDAGQPDAGDAGAPDGGDAGQPDAGEPDAGEPDGGDAGQADAGDAGEPDAGEQPDAGDGGDPDAGDPDAGQDAGPPPGCVNPSDCTSGICLASGDCLNCQSDSECADAGVCGTGVCASSCTTSLSCAMGQDCCGDRCVNFQRDPVNCGGCGTVCTPTQFCGRGLCREADFSQLCALTTTTVMLNGLTVDDDAGLAMGEALVVACAPDMASHLAGQDDAGVLSAAGEPLALGELLVMGGGSFRQAAVRWLEMTNRAHLHDTSTGVDAIYSLQDGGVASSTPFANLSETKDRIALQLVRTPTGSLVLNAAGFYATGTLAAAHYFIEQVLPQRATLTTRWYVIEWEDVNMSGGPDAADTFTVIASGT